jgi:hypothetical protein
MNELEEIVVNLQRLGKSQDEINMVIKYYDENKVEPGNTTDPAIADPNVESDNTDLGLVDGSSVLLDRISKGDFGDEPIPPSKDKEEVPSNIANFFTEPQALVTDNLSVHPILEGQVSIGMETPENFASEDNIEELNSQFKEMDITFSKGGGNSVLVSIPGMDSKRAFKLPEDAYGMKRLKHDITQYIRPTSGIPLGGTLASDIDDIWNEHQNEFFAEERMETKLGKLLGGKYKVESAGKMGNSFTVTKVDSGESRTFYVGGSDLFGHKNSSDELKRFLQQKTYSFEGLEAYKEVEEEIKGIVKTQYLDNPISIKEILKKTNVKDFYSIATPKNKEALIDYISSEMTHDSGRWAIASANFTSLTDNDFNGIIRQTIGHEVDLVWDDIAAKRGKKELVDMVKENKTLTPHQIEDVIVERHTVKYSDLEKTISYLNIQLDRGITEDATGVDIIDQLEAAEKMYGETESNYQVLFNRKTNKLASINQADAANEDIIDLSPKIQSIITSYQGTSREDLKAAFMRYSLALAEFEDETSNLKDVRSFYSLDFNKYVKSKPIGMQSDKFDVLIEQKVDLMSKVEALKRMYLLNESVLSITKDDLQGIRSTLGRSFARTVGTDVDGSFTINNGLSEAQTIAAMHEIMIAEGLPTNNLIDEHIKTGFTEHLAEVVGALPMTAVEFSAAGYGVGAVKWITGINKWRKALEASRFVKGNKIIPLKKVQEGAKIWSKGKVKFSGLSPAQIEGHYIFKMGISVKAPTAINKGKMLAVDLLTEGTVFTIVEGDIEGMAKGIGFGGVGKLLPAKTNSKWGVVNGLYKLLSGGVKMSAGNEAGGAFNASIKHITGNEQWGEYMTNHYGDLDEVAKRIAGDLIVGAGLHAKSVTRFDFKSLDGIKKSLQKYVNIRDSHVSAEGTIIKGKEIEFEKYQELAQLANQRVHEIEGTLDYFDPHLAPTVAAKEAAGIAKDIEGLGWKLNFKFDLPKGVDGKPIPGRKGDFRADDKSKTVDISIHPGKITPGVIAHEGHHAYTYLLMKETVTKGESLSALLEVTKKIQVGEGVTLYQKIQDVKVGAGLGMDLSKVKEMELFAYISEALRDGGYYSHIAGSKGFSKLGEWINGLGKTPTETKTANDIINWFGEYNKNIKEGYSQLSHFTKLSDIIADIEGTALPKIKEELANNRDKLGNIKFDKDVEGDIRAYEAAELAVRNDTKNILKEFGLTDADITSIVEGGNIDNIKSMGSEDLSSKRIALLKARQQVAIDKPNGWETTVKYYTGQINKVKEQIKAVKEDTGSVHSREDLANTADILLGNVPAELSSGVTAESTVASHKKNISNKSPEAIARNKTTVKNIKAIPNIESLRETFKEVISLNKRLNKHEFRYASKLTLTPFVKAKRIEIADRIKALKSKFSLAEWEMYSRLRHTLVMDNIGLVNKLAFLETQRSANVDARSRLDVREELIFELGTIVDTYHLNKQATNPKGEPMFDTKGNPIYVEFGAYANIVLPLRVPAAYERLNVGNEKGTTHKDISQIQEIEGAELDIYEQIDAKNRSTNIQESRIDLVERFEIDNVEAVMDRLTDSGFITEKGKFVAWSDATYENLTGMSKGLAEDILYNPALVASIKKYRGKERAKGYKSKGDPRYATSGPTKNLGAMIYLTKSDKVFDLFKNSLPEYTLDPATARTFGIPNVLQELFYRDITDPSMVSKNTGRSLATVFSDRRSLSTGLVKGNPIGSVPKRKINLTREQFLEAIGAKEVNGEVEFIGTSKSNFVSIIEGFTKELERAITNQVVRQAIRRGDVKPIVEVDYRASEIDVILGRGRGENLASESFEIEGQAKRIIDLLEKESKPFASKKDLIALLTDRLKNHPYVEDVTNIVRDVMVTENLTKIIDGHKQGEKENNHYLETNINNYYEGGRNTKFDPTSQSHKERLDNSKQILAPLLPSKMGEWVGVKGTHYNGRNVSPLFRDLDFSNVLQATKTQKIIAFDALNGKDGISAKKLADHNSTVDGIRDALANTLYDFINAKGISKSERESRIWIMDELLAKSTADAPFRILQRIDWIDLDGVEVITRRAVSSKGKERDVKKVVSKPEIAGGDYLPSWMEHWESHKKDMSDLRNVIVNKGNIKEVLAEVGNLGKALLRNQTAQKADAKYGVGSTLGLAKGLAAGADAAASIIHIPTGETLLSYIANHPNAKKGLGKKGFLEIKEIAEGYKNLLTKNKESLNLGSEDLTLQEYHRQAEALEKVLKLANKKNKKKKSISVWDLDDTLIKSSSKVLFTSPKGIKGELTAAEFASRGAALLKEGFEFDFTEFNKVVDGKEGPLFKEFTERVKKHGIENNFILTARPAESAIAIKEFLAQHGIDMPLKNITGLANSKANAKAQWVLDKAVEGYNDFYFADDASANVAAVKKILSQIDVKSNVQQALEVGHNKFDSTVNEMLERVFDIPAETEMSAGFGKNKKVNKDYIFGGHGISDFELLTYRLFGKGKEGEADQTFMKNAITKPYLKGTQAMHTANEKIATEIETLHGRNKDILDIIKEPVTEVFTNEHAIRAYLWTKSGKKIPGITDVDLGALLNRVTGNQRLLNYANVLQRIARLGSKEWVKPNANWIGESLKHDFFEITHGNTGRQKYLSESIENMELIFSKRNLNKMEAALGQKWRSNMEGMLQRMKSGSSTSNMKGWERNFVNWFNGASGVTMHLNMRSALTQTISMFNYIDMDINNPIAIARVAANPKQVVTDFMKIINSDYLRQRRKGGVMELSMAEVAEVANNPASSIGKALIAKLLTKGYAPTKWMDSFAIAFGGSAYYRNHIEHFLKEGKSQKEAEALAWEAFVEKTEPLQQSSDQMFLSNYQSTAAGKLMFTFKNTPIQMFRNFQKGALDLKNNRGSKLANIAKMAYYGPMQSMMFYAIQSSIWTSLFDDEGEVTPEQRTRQKERVFMGVLDSFLQGTGITGNALTTIKNTAITWKKEHDKGFSGDMGNIFVQSVGAFPTISIKARELKNIYNTTSKFGDFNKDLSKEVGWSIHNPYVQAGGDALSFAINAPAKRYVTKTKNIEEVIDARNTWWQRFNHFMGASSWDMGTEVEDLESKTRKVKAERKARGILKAKATAKSNRAKEGGSSPGYTRKKFKTY